MVSGNVGWSSLFGGKFDNYYLSSKCTHPLPHMRESILKTSHICAKSTFKMFIANNAICRNMDGPRDYHTKRSTSEKERQIPCDITYTWNLKYKSIYL